MNLQVLDPKTLTLDAIRKNSNNLYFINQNGNGEMFMEKFMNFNDVYPDQLIIMITPSETPKQPEEVISEKESIKPQIPRRKEILDYKFSGSNQKETIQIEFRPTNGGIRVSFKNREDAEEYYEYFRERFYDRDSQAISIRSIYEDLGIDKEIIDKLDGADRWGYPVIHTGRCTYITDVRKTKDSNMFGFTLRRPYIINGMLESGWFAKKQEAQNASVGDESVH